jgi:hypothetical protein
MTPTPTTPDDGLIRPLLETAGGFVLGAMTAFVGFRLRFNKIESRLDGHDGRFTDMANDHTAELLRLRNDINTRHEENRKRQDLMDRRQMFTLRLVADVARKLEVDKRVDDVVIEFLTSDKDES